MRDEVRKSVRLEASRERSKRERAAGFIGRYASGASAIGWLPEPVEIVPGSKLKVVGVSDDAPDHLKARYAE